MGNQKNKQAKNRQASTKQSASKPSGSPEQPAPDSLAEAQEESVRIGQEAMEKVNQGKFPVDPGDPRAHLFPELEPSPGSPAMSGPHPADLPVRFPSQAPANRVKIANFRNRIRPPGSSNATLSYASDVQYDIEVGADCGLGPGLKITRKDKKKGTILVPLFNVSCLEMLDD